MKRSSQNFHWTMETSVIILGPAHDEVIYTSYVYTLSPKVLVNY